MVLSRNFGLNGGSHRGGHLLIHSDEQVMRAILLDISSDSYLYADYPRVTHFGKAQSWTLNLPKESRHAKEAA